MKYLITLAKLIVFCAIAQQEGKRIYRKHPISQAKLDHRQRTNVPGRYRWQQAAPQAMSGYRIKGDGQGDEEKKLRKSFTTLVARMRLANMHFRIIF